MPTAFRIAVAQAELDDLRERLGRTRWPDAETVGDWSQGVPLQYLRDLCAYWQREYDWRRVEAELNSLPQALVDVDGLSIHVVHATSSNPDALPLLLTHGWPGSIVEFLDVLGPLTEPAEHGGDPADAFHVVCPSLPGYGFSEKPRAPGWGVNRIARAWATLMATLGYDRYGAQGGDWGAIVTAALAVLDAEHLAGIHLNMLPVDMAAIEALGEPTDVERRYLDGYELHRRWGSAYNAQQSTRPQTLGYGLVDSPAGQCAWIVEKLWAWTDHDGDAEAVISRDRMLDNVMLSWLPGAGASSARLYWERARILDATPIEVPAGYAAFPKEIFPLSQRWAQTRLRDLRRYAAFDRGGHFPSLERPDVFVDEVRALFRELR